MVHNTLIDGREKARARLRHWRSSGKHSTELETIIALFHPIMLGLGWDPTDTDRVRSDLTSNGKRPDISLHLTPGKPSLYIEAKSIHESTDHKDHVNQTVAYACTMGHAWVVITNGIEWRIIDVSAQKTATEKPCLIVNIEEDSPQRCLDLLSVLSYDALKDNQLSRIWREFTSEDASKSFLAGLRTHPKFLELMTDELDLTMAEADRKMAKIYDPLVKSLTRCSAEDFVLSRIRAEAEAGMSAPSALLRAAELPVQEMAPQDAPLLPEDSEDRASAPVEARSNDGEDDLADGGTTVSVGAMTVEPADPEAANLDEKPKYKRKTPARTRDFWEAGRITEGMKLFFRGLNDSMAQMVDGASVNYKGKILPYNKWRETVTSFPHPPLYESVITEDGTSFEEIRNEIEAEKAAKEKAAAEALAAQAEPEALAA